jgi:uncharacterized phage-associated protein
MNTITEFDSEKATQALNLFATLEGGKVNKMKALKLIWMADRFHIRKYGRPIIGDEYFAMKFGPVPSHAKNIAVLYEKLAPEILKYAKRYIKPVNNLEFQSIRKPEKSVFSKTDLEALESIYREFGWMKPFQLAEYSHYYPEWTKHKYALKKSRRIPMKYEDFFDDPKDINVEIFNLESSQLQAAQETFVENQKIEAIWNQA